MSLAIWIAAIVFLLSSSLAVAQNQRDIAVCDSDDSKAAVGACTRLLNSGRDREPLVTRFNRGLAHLALDEFDSAIEDFSAVLRSKPKHGGALLNRGLAYLYSERADQAISDLSEAIRVGYQPATAHLNRGSAYLDKKLYDHAIGDFTAALKFDTRDALAYYNRGVAYLEKGDCRSAIIDYSTALSFQTKYEYYNNRGLCYFSIGQFDKAIADQTAALQIDPNSSGSLVRRAEAHIAARNLAAGRADYKKAHEIDSTCTLCEARLLQIDGKKAEALTIYKRILQEDPAIVIRPNIEKYIAEIEGK